MDNTTEKQLQSNKITEKQLRTIIEQQKELNSLLSNIGVLESRKHSCLHQIADVNKRIEDFKGELQKEYGDININIQDGSYTFMEQPDEKPIV
jgi:predicted  nucleic acid-binding Zn-ribbon protein